MDIPAAQFKAECLKLMDLVQKTRVPVVITKHGRPVAQLAPISLDSESLFGYMKDTIKIEADVMAATDEKWSVVSGNEDDLYTRRSIKPARKK